MTELPFPIDEDGNIIPAVKAATPKKDDANQEPKQPEEQPLHNKTADICKEFRAYLTAVDQKNRDYRIKNYAPKGRGPKVAFPETVMSSLPADEENNK